LQPEDVISIRVFNEAQLSVSIQIGKDGNITAPFVGVIRAQGKTTTELEVELREAFIRRLRLRDPIVSVAVERFRPIRAAVSGLAVRPGIFEVRPGDSLLMLLSNAGGAVTDGRADMRRSTLKRAGSPELIPIDLHAMLVQGDTSQDFIVRDGDILNIPEETRNRIVVMGTIAGPRTIPYREPMTVNDAISLAGGPIPYRTRLSRILIIRELLGQPGTFKRMEVDLVRFIRQGDASQNILLQPGDILFVPDTGNIDFAQVNAVANIVFILDRVGFRILDRF
jgi:polysaccharide export outer membrane protein